RAHGRVGRHLSHDDGPGRRRQLHAPRTPVRHHRRSRCPVGHRKRKEDRVMPENTPDRGYTYPLYTDPAGDFPAQLQLMAEQMDTDIQALADTINAAYNK